MKVTIKVFYLGTCDTCSRIIKEVGVKDFDAQYREIKSEGITGPEIDEMAALVKSDQSFNLPPYESLFSKVALKYRALGLNEKKLTEKDYKSYILQEYTFLKRPVFIIGEQIMVGNAPKTVNRVKEVLDQLRKKK